MKPNSSALTPFETYESPSLPIDAGSKALLDAICRNWGIEMDKFLQALPKNAHGKSWKCGADCDNLPGWYSLSQKFPGRWEDEDGTKSFICSKLGGVKEYRRIRISGAIDDALKHFNELGRSGTEPTHGPQNNRNGIAGPQPSLEPASATDVAAGAGKRDGKNGTQSGPSQQNSQVREFDINPEGHCKKNDSSGRKG
jgi:hypothetical protein